MTTFLAHSGAQPLFMQSPFSAELAPTKSAIARGAYSDQLYATLIAGVPDSDGVGGAPLAMSAQPVSLTPFSATHWAVIGVTDLCPEDSSAARTLVLINLEGQREAYGALRSSRAGPQAASIIHLPSHRILVRRIPQRIGPPSSTPSL